MALNHQSSIHITMKTNLLILSAFILSTHALWAQKFISESGKVTFFSEAAIEDIAADNTSITSIFDVGNGEIAFSVPIVDFEFEKSLMKEHFNEKYMETEKYPKSTFKGVIYGFDQSKAGKQKVRAEGDLLIHGVTRRIKTEGEAEKKDGKILIASKFMVRLEDHKVKIPKLLWQNIAEEVEVTLNMKFKPYEN